jgi:hypothetical protein
MFQVRSLVLQVLFIPFLAAGCGGAKLEANPNAVPVFPVTGKVTYKNAPVEGATVRFLTLDGKTGSSGKTDKEGKFSLTTYAANDGAAAGKHFVAITKTEGGTADQGSGDMASGNYVPPNENAKPTPIKELLPKKYGVHSNTNPLKAEVKETKEPGGNYFEFDLKD